MVASVVIVFIIYIFLKLVLDSLSVKSFNPRPACHAKNIFCCSPRETPQVLTQNQPVQKYRNKKIITLFNIVIVLMQQPANGLNITLFQIE